MIACFQEMHRISRRFGADFDEVVDFLEDTHRVRLDRPVMFLGVISGHCVIPNAEMLLKSYNSEFLRLILESNHKRKEEIRDENVYEEAERLGGERRLFKGSCSHTVFFRGFACSAYEVLEKCSLRCTILTILGRQLVISFAVSRINSFKALACSLVPNIPSTHLAIGLPIHWHRI